jgi:predicted nucleic acid-binding Zn ribbon protein
VRNPLTSEQGAFALLLWVGAVALVVVAIVLVVRAL